MEGGAVQAVEFDKNLNGARMGGMSRAKQGETLAVACLAFSGAAAGTSFTSVGMTWTAGIAMVAGLAGALFGLIYSRRSEEKEESARNSVEAAKEARAHDEFLNELVRCGNQRCQASAQKFMCLRKNMWKMPPDSLAPVLAEVAVCGYCFKRLMGRDPVDGKDRRGFI